MIIVLLDGLDIFNPLMKLHNIFQIKISQSEILPDHTLAFHAAAFDAVIHAQLGPGHEK